MWEKLDEILELHNSRGELVSILRPLANTRSAVSGVDIDDVMGFNPNVVSDLTDVSRTLSIIRHKYRALNREQYQIARYDRLVSEAFLRWANLYSIYGESDWRVRGAEAFFAEFTVEWEHYLDEMGEYSDLISRRLKNDLVGNFHQGLSTHLSGIAAEANSALRRARLDTIQAYLSEVATHCGEAHLLARSISSLCSDQSANLTRFGNPFDRLRNQLDSWLAFYSGWQSGDPRVHESFRNRIPRRALIKVIKKRKR